MLPVVSEQIMCECVCVFETKKTMNVCVTGCICGKCGLTEVRLRLGCYW